MSTNGPIGPKPDLNHDAQELEDDEDLDFNQLVEHPGSEFSDDFGVLQFPHDDALQTEPEVSPPGEQEHVFLVDANKLRKALALATIVAGRKNQPHTVTLIKADRADQKQDGLLIESRSLAGMCRLHVPTSTSGIRTQGPFRDARFRVDAQLLDSLLGVAKTARVHFRLRMDRQRLTLVIDERVRPVAIMKDDAPRIAKGETAPDPVPFDLELFQEIATYLSLFVPMDEASQFGLRATFSAARCIAGTNSAIGFALDVPWHSGDWSISSASLLLVSRAALKLEREVRLFQVGTMRVLEDSAGQISVPCVADHSPSREELLAKAQAGFQFLVVRSHVRRALEALRLASDNPVMVKLVLPPDTPGHKDIVLSVQTPDGHEWVETVDGKYIDVSDHAALATGWSGSIELLTLLKVITHFGSANVAISWRENVLLITDELMVASGITVRSAFATQ
ncbi:hypothetical protein EMQ25_11640 [Arsenicitalea aurantiaca]|uniref:DNA polymerase III beta sliding clamp central domain-containing protein n=1 Tax=Arsenicitalea aurantiaca TaxID=1783274 RepID=A0A433X7F4_9HYPH|nr:hypothetical protein [Arsenicitalea aurantiaca]RUT29985.1 hypothetical protein EMQ25_11640 [Arsenicitalea aurantiaca]